MPPLVLLFQLLPLPHRQLIAAVIIGIGGMTLDPVGADGVLLTEIQKFRCWRVVRSPYGVTAHSLEDFQLPSDGILRSIAEKS